METVYFQMMKEHRPYRLHNYDPHWKNRFIEVKEKLTPIFSRNLVEIDHVGSTSIEGMVAKPQVDVLAVVEDLGLVEKCRDELITVGFKPLGTGYVSDDDYTIAQDATDGSRLTTVHVLQKGNPKIEEYKIFRDYLRVNKEDRDLYIATKRELYVSHKENYAAYDGGKKDVIDGIKARAKVWASK